MLKSTAPAKANDTFAEMAAGGIQISRSAEIEMTSEDLYISPSEVRVDYTFRNTTDKDIETTVAFPMPELSMDVRSIRRRNWQGGCIGRYHLTIDKERAQDIVSFCGDGVKKTGPTTFEIEATDYDPSRNIDVLIVRSFVSGN